MSSETPKQSRRNSTLEQIALINKEQFTSDDYYSSAASLSEMVSTGLEYIVEKQDGRVVGYILFYEFPTHIESLRRALTRSAIGKGLGVKLTQRLVRIAKRRGKGIYTYVSKTNLPSLNSNIKCGYRVQEIGKDFVYIWHKGGKDADS